MKKYSLWFLAVVLMISCTNQKTESEESAIPEEEEKIVSAESTELYEWLSDSEKDEIIRFHGQEIVGKATQVLGTRLRAKLEQSGAKGAVQYCTHKGLLLTDSLGAMDNVLLRRTSLKNRNLVNAPDEIERSILEIYEQEFKDGMQLEPKTVMTYDGSIRYLSPIYVQPVCLNCHGSENDISEEVKAEIKKNYPADLATGYQAGEFRGMWDVIVPNL